MSGSPGGQGDDNLGQFLIDIELPRESDMVDHSRAQPSLPVDVITVIATITSIIRISLEKGLYRKTSVPTKVKPELDRMAQEDCKLKAVVENLMKLHLKIKVKKRLGFYLVGGPALSGARAYVQCPVLPGK